MLIDKTDIYVKAGDGGNGAIAFHREKYVAAGGPSGGDGGHGGNVVFRVDEGMNTLLAFKYKHKFIAENGGNGGTEKFHGKNGDDIIIRVPAGTLIRDKETGKIIHDMSSGDDFVACRGGRGGWGNRHFATPTRQAPRFAKNGTKGEELNLTLELKMIADVGLVGFPNVGKSSILSLISAAKPKIAGYHFTTLSPNLGVVSTGDGGRGFVAADIPGLIEGASEGAGLGHEFLRHVDRCRLLLHVFDVAGSEGRDPIDDIKKINEELARYSQELASRPQILVANKTDLIYEEDADLSVIEYYARENSVPLFYVSAATGKGLLELVRFVGAELKKLPPITVYEPEFTAEDEALRNSIDQTETKIRRENNTFYVEGVWLYNLMGQINFSDYESTNFFQRVLTRRGVFDMLRERGATDGHIVNIYGFEFEFVN